jgi:GcrA cell cycle regulator
VTRNAVIGKANRLKLERRRYQSANNPRSSRPLSAAAARRIPSPRKPRRDPPLPPITKPDVIHLHDSAIPMEQRKSLMQLRDCDCHFPVGDPMIPAEFFYCGGAVQQDDGRAYCDGHRARMYYTPRRSRGHMVMVSLEAHRAVR